MAQRRHSLYGYGSRTSAPALDVLFYLLRFKGSFKQPRNSSWVSPHRLSSFSAGQHVDQQIGIAAPIPCYEEIQLSLWNGAFAALEPIQTDKQR